MRTIKRKTTVTMLWFCTFFLFYVSLQLNHLVWGAQHANPQFVFAQKASEQKTRDGKSWLIFMRKNGNKRKWHFFSPTITSEFIFSWNQKNEICRENQMRRSLALLFARVAIFDRYFHCPINSAFSRISWKSQRKNIKTFAKDSQKKIKSKEMNLTCRQKNWFS